MQFCIIKIDVEHLRTVNFLFQAAEVDVLYLSKCATNDY